MTSTHDLIVIGGGAGGLTAAREGVRLGARTALIHDGPLGGECTFTGCVPSKALLSGAAGGLGFDKSMAGVRDAVKRIATTEDAETLRNDGVEVVKGRGSFLDRRTVQVGSRRLEAPRIVIATGSRATRPRIDGLDGLDVLTNETLFDLDSLPERLAIIGGGPIGCEMAQAFSGLGTDVTVVEALPRVLARDEPEASSLVERALGRRGVEIHTATTTTSVRPANGTIGTAVVVLDNGIELEVDRILLATGRTPVTDGLDLERAGVSLDRRGAVTVDDTMVTNVRGIWAVGDVTGRRQLTHAAVRMALVAVENAFRGRLQPLKRVDPLQVPWVTYTDPEVAHIGVTEAEAPAGARVAIVPMDEVDRAITAGRTEGFVKLIAGPRRLTRNLGGGRILGATIVAPRAGEMIHEVALAMRVGAFTGRLAQTVHAYPSWSMAVQEAAVQFFTTHRGRQARPVRSGSTDSAAGPTPGAPGPAQPG